MAVAVRHPSGEVVVHSEPLNARLYGSVWAKRPFIRGVLMLWDTLALGMKALVFSANVALEEEDEEKKPLPLVAPHAGTPAAGTAGEGLRGEAGVTAWVQRTALTLTLSRWERESAPKRQKYNPHRSSRPMSPRRTHSRAG